MEKSSNIRFMIYIDILSIFKIGRSIQWESFRENSIFRILYLSSVLYSFRFPEKESPFNIYKFSIDFTGPYDASISKAIAFLLKDDFIERSEGEDVFRIGRNFSNEIFEINLEEERTSWIKQIIYILGIYGENKIYEFIFRDPEYQNTIKSNTNQGLNTTIDNQTVQTLSVFKEAFEESLGDNAHELSSQRYLELYFEYVFSRILKREE
ncbi:hypothetical protein ASG38_12235 [Flavobacterium sp. Leaf359]|uniref:hypothetical protein n=1 Tax=Flavobacterium sp. Leaf359 TaxID=1736351 RepID=UPI0006F526FA|nr:hypothetical protein [Flavobacterium sp. Leaf359]KQS46556.1 hypothetical protein ASG38_12235 [Flavobacterium sp. Leaf359]